VSTILTRKGADYSLNSVKFTPPVSTGLQGWWYLGGLTGDDAPTALARTTKNLAGTSAAMTAVGSPVISTGYVTLDATHSLDTTILETMDFSWVFLVLPTAILGKFGGHYVSSSRSTMMATSNVTTTVQSLTPRDTGSGTTTQQQLGLLTLGAGFTAMRMLCCTMNGATGAGTMRDLTGGTTATPVTLTSTRVVASPTIGFQLGGAGATGVRLGFVAVYNRALSNAELDAIHTFVAKYRLAKYGDIV
jgi:hypothetical protein